MNSGPVWHDPVRIERLKSLLAEGKSFTEIAMIFGDCTRGSIGGAASRLGLKATRKPPPNRVYASEKARRLAADKRRRERLKAAGIKRVYKARPSATKPSPPPAVRAPGDPIPFQSYRYLIQCAWIMEEGDRFTAEKIAVCGHETNGEVYCRFHAGLSVSAYQRPTGRVMSLGISMRARG